MAAIAFIGFIVWAHHMFVSGMNPYFGFFFAVSTLIIAIPSAVKVYNWLLTLWRGNIRLNVPMLFGIGWISTFIIGGLTGLPLGNVVARRAPARHVLRRGALSFSYGRGGAHGDLCEGFITGSPK
jgi:heme/copper-type cytochrome/quinol oxidase subunit 1